MAFVRNAGFTSGIATDPADTAAGYLTPDRYNLAHVVAGAEVGGIPYCPTASTETTSANFLYTETSGPRLQVGTTGTSAGWFVGYYGDSGNSALWSSTLTPDVNNYNLRTDGVSTILNCPTSSGGYTFRIAGVQIGTWGGFGTAGVGLTITAGTATTDVNALSITQTMNAAAVGFTGIKGTFTEGASGTAAGTLLMNLLYGTSGAEATQFSVSKAGATFTNTIELGHASDTTISKSAAGVIAVEGVVIPSISSTNTLTNKWVKKRVTTITTHTTGGPPAELTIDYSATNMHVITAQSAALKYMNPTGSPGEGDALLIKIQGDGSARALTWDTQFDGGSGTLPTTTAASTFSYFSFIFNATDTTWDYTGTAAGF